MMTLDTFFRKAAEVVGYILAVSRCTLISRLFIANRLLEKRPSHPSPSGAASTAQGLSSESVTSGASQVECR